MERIFDHPEIEVLLDFISEKYSQGFACIKVSDLKNEISISTRGYRSCMKGLREIGLIKYKQIKSNKKQHEKSPFFIEIMDHLVRPVKEAYLKFHEKLKSDQIERVFSILENSKIEAVPIKKEVVIPDAQDKVKDEDLKKAESLFMPSGYNTLCRKQKEDLRRAINYRLEKEETLENIFKALSWKKSQIESKKSYFCSPAKFIMDGYQDFKVHLPIKPIQGPSESIKGYSVGDSYMDAISLETKRIQKDIEDNIEEYSKKHPQLMNLNGFSRISYIQNNIIDTEHFRKALKEESTIKSEFKDSIKIISEEPKRFESFISAFQV